MKTMVNQLKTQILNCSVQEILAYFLREYQGRIALASSLGAEDQVLTDIMLKIEPSARVFTLDTGRLPQETFTVITDTMQKYGMRFEIYFPQTQTLEKMMRQYGPNLFYESVDFRKHCCQVRKVEPLQRALGTMDVWITGLRREQAVTRTGIKTVEWDEEHGLLKLNPLSEWTTEQVWSYIKTQQVPYNPLHDQGYPSIGCAPCTRSVGPGEDARAGRWWWEVPEHKECGLHYRDDKLV